MTRFGNEFGSKEKECVIKPNDDETGKQKRKQEKCKKCLPSQIELQGLGSKPNHFNGYE